MGVLGQVSKHTPALRPRFKELFYTLLDWLLACDHSPTTRSVSPGLKGLFCVFKAQFFLCMHDVSDNHSDAENFITSNNEAGMDNVDLVFEAARVWIVQNKLKKDRALRIGPTRRDGIQGNSPLF